MNIFNLPDLGEGLPDAEIHEWFVKEGDTVHIDQPLVSMETAKAVVDVPSPEAGTIAKIFGQPGDIIKTGAPLVAFTALVTPRVDKGTVVGHLEEAHDVSEDHFFIGSPASSQRTKATPTVRLFAKKLGVHLDTVVGSGEHGMITRDDVQREADLKSKPPEGFEPLRGVRRAMLASMVQSHQDVVPVTLFDEVDVACWNESTDITVRLIHAVAFACQQEPSLNAWFDTTHKARQCFDQVHLGIAMDSEEGLFVPVIHDVTRHSDEELRSIIDAYKKAVQARAVPPEHLRGATIILSNFGKFAGRFASPIIVPPMVAILAVGRLYEGVVSHHGKIEAHRLLPLSLSFDHRAVTGGEATRFLGAIMKALSAPLSVNKQTDRTNGI
jgi:2-oxoisovalerate dehydrogenase E2 component (dihydrolipoyl transacylase)